MRHLLLLALVFPASAWAQAPVAPGPAGKPALLLAQKKAATGADELVEAARQQLQAGKAQRALALAQQARRADPASYKPAYYIAYALMALGDFDGAAQAQDTSLQLAHTPEQKAAAQALGEAIAAQGLVREADAAAEEGLDAKAARLYQQAFDAGLQRPEVALKAAKLLEERVKNVPGAIDLLRAVQARFPGSPAAGTAGAELARLQPAIAAVAQVRMRIAHATPPGTRQQLLESVLAMDPAHTDVLYALANEAAAGADWAALEARLKLLQQRRLLDEGMRLGKLRPHDWKQDPRLKQLFDDIWGASTADKVLGLAPRSIIGLQIEPAEGQPQVSTVVAGGPAQKAGLAAGDRIVFVGGVRVGSARELQSRLAVLPAGLPAAIVVQRDGKQVRFYASPDNNASQAGDCIALGLAYESYEGGCKGGLAEGAGRATYIAVNDVRAVYEGGFSGGFAAGKGQTTLHTASGPKVFEMLDGKEVGQ